MGNYRDCTNGNHTWQNPNIMNTYCTNCSIVRIQFVRGEGILSEEKHADLQSWPGTKPDQIWFDEADVIMTECKKGNHTWYDPNALTTYCVICEAVQRKQHVRQLLDVFSGVFFFCCVCWIIAIGIVSSIAFSTPNGVLVALFPPVIVSVLYVAGVAIYRRFKT